jgi:hypothetical protein
MIRKKLYQWHRTLSLIVAIPVIFWAMSGFMHPIMTIFRPEIAKQAYSAPAIDSSQLKVSLSEALRINNYPIINSFRIIQIKGNHFYQIKLPGEKILRYISTTDGKLLYDGDNLYARYLAKYFLLGDIKNKTSNNPPPSLEKQEEAEGDCCAMATNAVLSKNNGVLVNKVTFWEDFDSEYKAINRLLPVYRVDFKREDDIRIYVETSSDRLGLAFDNTRSFLDTMFQLFHNMSWLNTLGNWRLVIEIIIMSLTFLTALMGIYIFFTTKSKSISDKALPKARRNHRYTSIFASFFTLLFTFSGAFHALQKFEPDTRENFYVENTFSGSELDLNWEKLSMALEKDLNIQNISLVKMNKQNYWQVYLEVVKGTKDFKKGSEMSAVTRDAIYLKANDYSLLANGEEQYARYLASSFNNDKNAKPNEVKQITKFAGEYGFVNKRLPVWKLGYETNYNERFYVETSSGKLSVRIDDREVFEGLSFSFLHKHHFLDFAGKSWRDFSTMFWAAMQVAMIVVGLVLWSKAKRAKKRISQT